MLGGLEWRVARERGTACFVARLGRRVRGGRSGGRSRVWAGDETVSLRFRDDRMESSNWRGREWERERSYG